MKRYKILVVISVAIVTVAIWRGCKGTPGEPAEEKISQSTDRKPRVNEPSIHERMRQSEREYADIVAGKLRKIAKEMNEPVEFYGRVVEQDGSPLEGVVVAYRITAIPDNPVPGGPNKITKDTTDTDTTGRFSISDYKGWSLSFSLKKEGFRGRGGGAYFIRNEPECHRPDLAKPVEFMLINDDLPRAEKIYDKRLKFVWNAGEVSVDLGPELGNLVLLPTRSGYDPGNSRAHFDWSVVVRTNGFEIAPLSEGSLRMAPIGGYQPGHQYSYPRAASNWRRRVDDKYGILTQGSQYGFMELELYGDGDDNGMCGAVTIFLNKSGARNIDHK